MSGRKNVVGKKRATAVVLAVGAGFLLVGCGAGETASVGDGVSVVEIEAALYAPEWASDEGTVFALQSDGRRLVSFDASAGFGGGLDPLTLSDEVEGVAGENLALQEGREPDNIYLPIPERDQVLVLENDDLLEVRNFGVGNAPARVALGGEALGLSAPTLYALSEDGSTVTVVGLENSEVIAEVETPGASLIEAGGAGEFWLAGPEGVALYGGAPLGRQAGLSLEAGSLVVDDDNRQRAYVSDSASGRVAAVEPGADGELRTAAETDIGAAVEYLEVREGRLYAVTRDELVVLDPETLGSVGTVEFGPALEEEGLGDARPSGLTVEEENAYVTLEDQPYVLVIEKP